MPPVDVVIAEDSRIQSQILQKRLREAGYNVRAAPNGAEALELIRQQSPDIIISDIEMPEMTGYELCKAVKSDPQLKKIPLILLSTLSDPADIIEGLHAGADNYVTKPYESKYLLSRVESLLHTPVGEEGDQDTDLEVSLAGKTYRVRSGRQQVLNLLISTFENAVEKNQELIRVNQDLTHAKEELTQKNHDLTELNEKLETANSRMTRDLDAAAKVQQSLLPSSEATIPEAALAWRYIPCDELAGDFLNCFSLDDKHLALFVVDVSGHGVASSLLSVTIGRVLTPQVTSASLLVRRSEDGSGRVIVPPAEVIAELNQRFPMEEQGGLYFTIAYGIFNRDTREFRFASGGHTPLVWQKKSGDTEMVDADGMAIGWLEDVDFEETRLQLQPGDRLYLYSDGVPEAMDPDLNEYGDQRMLQLIAAGRQQPLDEAVAALLASVTQWCSPTGPRDDVSILALEAR
jgi:sigma-B regulation protein RsbU (phosphoserine phosphatase)